MPNLVLDHPVQVPVRELERCLTQAIPSFRWRAGDDSSAAAVGLERPLTVMGIAGAEIIMMVIELRPQPLPLEAGAPPHRLHMHLSEPSTEHSETAKRIVLIAAAVILEGSNGMAQLAPDGPWYHSGELKIGRERLLRDPARANIDEFLVSHGERYPSAAPAGQGEPSPLAAAGLPPGSPAERMMSADLDHTFSKILTEIGGADMAKEMGYAPPPSYAEEEPRADRLPTFVLALAHPIDFDWQPLMKLDQFDGDGNWQVQPGPKGFGTLTGRGATIRVEASPDPIPRYMLENALARSFWLEGGSQILAGQTCSLIVTCDLDTRATPFEDVRETAKVMTLLLGLLTRTPGCLALLNNGVHTLLDPAAVQSQTGHLHKNQIPLMLWTWTAPDSMVKDSVSLTTGGLLPFLGYELEVWNAPGDPQWIADKLGGLMNYLLHVGPVVKDGDSFGETKGDKSIRGFFGTTRAQRHDKTVKALMLEFAGPAGAAAPRPDELPAQAAPQSSAPTPAPAPGPLVDLVSLVALTKPTVFPSKIIQEMLESGFPGMIWTVRVGAATEPHRIEGSGEEGRVTAFVSAYGLTIPRDLMPPPHRLHLTVAIGAHGNLALARRVSLVLCSCLIISLDKDAHFQLSADGNWLSHDDAMTGVVVPRHTKDIGDFDQAFGSPPGRFRDASNPADAYPPAPDEHFTDFRAIRASAGPATGAGLKAAMDQGLGRSPNPPPPAPRGPGGFGRRLFGRRGS